MTRPVLRGCSTDTVHLSSEHNGGHTVITVRGDLDVLTSQQLDGFLVRARRRHHRIILDLAGVEFMDTSSLAVIVHHWRALAAEGGMLVLAGARYRHTRALWITGLAHRLPLYETVEDAVRALPAQRADTD